MFPSCCNAFDLVSIDIRSKSCKFLCHTHSSWSQLWSRWLTLRIVSSLCFPIGSFTRFGYFKLTMLLTIYPMAGCNFSINVTLLTITMTYAFLEHSFIASAVRVKKFAFAMKLVVLILPLIPLTIEESFDAVPIALMSEPLTFISSSICKSNLLTFNASLFILV